MNFRKFLHILFFSLFLLLLLVQNSCEKFSGSQSVPSYIKIDSIRLNTDYSTQGSARHSIVDAWVYIDGTLIGTYQLPATFPVLSEGTHSIMVFPGIKKDGIASTRITYPFYQDITLSKSLAVSDTLNLGILSTNYFTSAKFVWKEDFDDVAVTIDSTSISTAKLRQTPSGDPLTLEGLHSGIVELDTIGSTYQGVSHYTYPIPTTPVFMEMNFNINTYLTIGVYVTTVGIINQVPIMTLVPTQGIWKKIYIDLTTMLNAYSGATQYRVYFYAKNTTGDHYRILMDNIKVLSF
ncbi:MAG: hypothetical protein NTW10_13260 [Bacteroidetes bacterium]|nr:hypothetical protein [Bacteroidota bacterium]